MGRASRSRCRRQAAPAPLAGVDTNARTVTSPGAGAPGVGAGVTANYRGLRLVRLAEPLTLQGITKRYVRYEIALEEVTRD